ncbi:DUF6053 domain-containing protein [Lysobacter yananisis]
MFSLSAGAKRRQAASVHGCRGEAERRIALVGGPSGPMLLCRIAAIWAESIGPEGPPTTAGCGRRRPVPAPELRPQAPAAPARAASSAPAAAASPA